MKCDNIDQGCDWKGMVGTLEDHSSKCGFSSVSCPNECKTISLLRKEVDEHLKKECPNRDYQCQYCGEKGTYTKIVNIHDYTCGKKIISCPKCAAKMERAKWNNHIKDECEFTVIPCKYESIGCLEIFERKYMKAHEEDDSFHLHKALDAVVKLQREKQSITDGLWQLNEKTETIILKKGEPFTFKVTDYERRKIGDLFGDFHSQTFYTSHEGYHMQINVAHMDDYYSHIGVFIHIRRGDYDQKLQWPFTGIVTIELLNQLADEKHHSEKTSITFESTRSQGFPEFIAHTALPYCSETNTQYLKDDTLYFRVKVDISDYKPWLECTTAL